MADVSEIKKSSIHFLTVHGRAPVILTPEIKKSRFVGRYGSGVFRCGGGLMHR